MISSNVCWRAIRWAPTNGELPVSATSSRPVSGTSRWSGCAGSSARNAGEGLFTSIAPSSTSRSRATTARRIWTFPLNGDTQGRFPPGASAAVWRSEDGGESWQEMAEGLPREKCFFTVLRQSMATDRVPQTGVYFGTNSGSVFASRDRGAHWDEIARHLPTVLSVETV